jgi:hypothetical protein
MMAVLNEASVSELALKADATISCTECVESA